VHTICTRDEYLTDYTALFSRGFESISGLQQEFAAAFGSSYEALDPTLVDLVEQAAISSGAGPSLDQRRDICTGKAFASSLQLDQIIISCFFAIVEDFCPENAREDESFAFTIENTRFRLPDIRWSYGKLYGSL